MHHALIVDEPSRFRTSLSGQLGAALDAAEVLEADGGALCIRHDWRDREKVIRPELFELQARRHGITRVEVSEALQAGFEGRTVGFYREPGSSGAGIFPQETRLLPIIARPPLEERSDVGWDGHGEPRPKHDLQALRPRRRGYLDARQAKVRDDDVEGEALQLLERRLAGRRLDHLESFVGQPFRDHAPQRLLVIDEEDIWLGIRHLRRIVKELTFLVKAAHLIPC